MTGEQQKKIDTLKTAEINLVEAINGGASGYSCSRHFRMGEYQNHIKAYALAVIALSTSSGTATEE